MTRRRGRSAADERFIRILAVVAFFTYVAALVFACGKEPALPTSPNSAPDAEAGAPDGKRPRPAATTTSPFPSPSPPNDTASDASAAIADGALGPSAARLLNHRGMNLSGGEFGACCPGRIGLDYAYPTKLDVDLMIARGVTHLRVPFRHERIQRALRAPLDETEWVRLRDVIAYALGRSPALTVAIEPHNFARYNGALIGATDLADLWGRVVNRLRADGLTPTSDAGGGRVWPNLTNEPHDMATEAWLAVAKESVHEMRRVGFTGRILVPGNAWTGAAHWTSTWYGASNASLMGQIADPLATFEVHLYLDADGSGKGAECVSETIGVERLRGFVEWLRVNKRTGYLGEIGAPNTPKCAAAVKSTLAYVESEPALWLGWAWWSTGSRWNPTYPLSLQPVAVDAGGVTLYADRPQLEWLRPFLLPCPR